MALTVRSLALAVLAGGGISIASPATAQAPSCERASALGFAAAYENADAVRRLLDENVGVNCVSTSQTALILAARWNQAATVKLLLERGADPDIVNADGRTALELAASSGYAEVTRILAEHMGVADPLAPKRREPPVTPARTGPADAGNPAPAAQPAAPGARSAEKPVPTAAKPAPASQTPAPAAEKVPAAAGGFAKTRVKPTPGVWTATVTNQQRSTLVFRVAADGTISDVEYKGWWRCKGSSGYYEYKQTDLDGPPGSYRVVDGAFAEKKNDTETRMWWSFEGHFTSPTAAKGMYHMAWMGTECTSNELQWTARPAR